MRKLIILVALILLGIVATSAHAVSVTTEENGMEIWTQGWRGNDALIVRDTAGAAMFTIAADGAVTFGNTVGITGDVIFTGTITVNGAGGVIFENDETITNVTDDYMVITGGSGTADTDVTVDLDNADGPIFSVAVAGDWFEFAETVEISASGGIIMSGGDTITQPAADIFRFSCTGTCADATDFEVDVDGTHPVLQSNTDGTIEVAEILDVSGGVIVMANDEEIDNSVNGTVTVTADILQASAALDVVTTTTLGDHVSLESLEQISNDVDGTITLTEIGGTNKLALSFDLEGVGAGTAVQISSSTSTQIDILEVIGGENGETMENSTDDQWLWKGVGGGDDTDIRYTLDGTHPVIDSPTDALIEFAENVKIDGTGETTGVHTFGAAISGTDIVTATNITNVVRTISLPPDAWRTEAGANPLSIVAGTAPNTAQEGNFNTFEWATGEQASKITTTFKVPHDFVSGAELHIIHLGDGVAANNAETFSLTYYNAKTGEADNPGAIDECGTPCALSAEAETLTETVIALDGGSIEAGDTVRAVFGFAAIDQTMHMQSAWIEYTATQ